MRVKVSQLRANPYRNINEYPILREKVDGLKNSIESTGFWDNIPVRVSKDGEGYEIPYGHHRLQALREMEVEEIEAPVKQIDDASMLRMMAEENLDVYKASPRIINETVLAAKEFIDAELAKYETWEEFRSAKNSIPIETEPEFRSVKGKGAGRNIICAFLGKNFLPWMVEGALKVIGQPERFNRKAVEKFDSAGPARTFMQQVQKWNVPPEKQGAIADRVVEETGGKGYERIQKVVEQTVIDEGKEREEAESDITPRLQGPDDPNDELSELVRIVRRRASTTASKIKQTVSDIQSFIDFLSEHNIEEMTGVERNEIVIALRPMRRAVAELEEIVSFEEFEDGSKDEASA